MDADNTGLFEEILREVQARDPSQVQEAMDAVRHNRLMRLESIRLALDTVVTGSDDPSGQATATDVLAVAQRYLGYILGLKPE